MRVQSLSGFWRAAAAHPRSGRRVAVADFPALACGNYSTSGLGDDEIPVTGSVTG